MSQQINLLNPALRKQKEWLTSANMVFAVAGFLLLLVAASLYTYRQTRQLEAEHAQWTRQAEDAKASMAQATQQFPVRQPSPMLQAEITGVEEKLKARDQVLDVLNSGVIGKTQGFSSILEAFARQTVQGLWLTRIQMGSSGDRMSIGGNALSADLIPQYITRLSAEQALHGRNFNAFQVGQSKPITSAGNQTAAHAVVPSYVEFVLSADKVAEVKSGMPGKPVPEAKQ